MDANNTVQVGEQYQHYKHGNIYEIVCIGYNADNRRPMVGYKGLYKDVEFGYGTLWFRDMEEFMGNVKTWNGAVKRFTKIIR